MSGQAFLRSVDGPLGEWQCLIDTPGLSQSKGLARGSLSGNFHGSPVTSADKLYPQVSCRGKCPAAATGVTARFPIRGSRATTEKSGNLLRSRVKGRSFPLTGAGSLSHIE